MNMFSGVTYGESLGIDAVLNHGDADGEGASVEVAVLFGRSEFS